MTDRDDVAYLVGADGELVEMRATLFASEDDLQNLVARYPKLLAGAQMTPEEPRRWLLVRREMGVPVTADGSDYFSVDHLFVDQEAVPTVVEVKRSTDTRIRRHVVGQMLDYAANGVRYWPADRLRDLYESQCRDDDRDPLEHLRDVVRPDVEPDAFWPQVEENLKAGRIRMVFVADLIPPELTAIVEFLNVGMTHAEVYAVELPQFLADNGLRTLVPRLVGRPAQADRSQQRRSYPPLDEVLAGSEDHVRSVDRLLRTWADDHGLQRRETQTAIIYSAGTADLAYFAPGDALVWIYLSHLRDAGLDDQADAHRAAFQALVSGKSLSQHQLGIPTHDLAEHWAAAEPALNNYLTATLAAIEAVQEKLGQTAGEL